MTAFSLEPIGVIRSEIKNTRDAPLFYDEGAPNAFLDLDPAFTDGLLRMKPGDEIIVETGGGGGYGPPSERSRELIERDVRRGYISAEAAEREYGIEINIR